MCGMLLREDVARGLRSISFVDRGIAVVIVEEFVDLGYAMKSIENQGVMKNRMMGLSLARIL